MILTSRKFEGTRAYRRQLKLQHGFFPAYTVIMIMYYGRDSEVTDLMVKMWIEMNCPKAAKQIGANVYFKYAEHAIQFQLAMQDA